jgi:hypothetical protein
MDSDGDHLPDDWEVQHGLDPHGNGSTIGKNGPLGDANGNGLVNILEYVLAPDAAVSNGWLAASRQTNPADGHDYLVVTYRRRIGLLDFKCVIEMSEDLGGLERGQWRRAGDSSRDSEWRRFHRDGRRPHPTGAQQRRD